MARCPQREHSTMWLRLAAAAAAAAGFGGACGVSMTAEDTSEAMDVSHPDSMISDFRSRSCVDSDRRQKVNLICDSRRRLLAVS